jgi:hypothetical protein
LAAPAPAAAPKSNAGAALAGGGGDAVPKSKAGVSLAGGGGEGGEAAAFGSGGGSGEEKSNGDALSGGGSGGGADVGVVIAGAAALPSVAAGTGILVSHFGHFTRRPAAASGAFNFALQLGHRTEIGMDASTAGLARGRHSIAAAAKQYPEAGPR